VQYVYKGLGTALWGVFLNTGENPGKFNYQMIIGKNI